MSAVDILKNLPTLETKRLTLRKLCMEDAADMYEYACDPEIASFGLWLPFHSIEDSKKDLAEVIEGYNKGEIFVWAMELKTERKMIGRIGLGDYSFRNARAEVGYASNRKYWGKGLMTEAVKQIIDFSFAKLGMNRISAVCLPDNVASIRILEKVGMQLEGVKREYTFIRGKFDDLNLYSILKKEWQSAKK
ncbi:GCN5-related N-acetyltransferase (plasmid) [Kalymmatonema gypsitolerans NIES-4073]|nr:GCN5-related N-acetyltransferase [Scytonema sp. NIES-4073]